MTIIITMIAIIAMSILTVINEGGSINNKTYIKDIVMMKKMLFLGMVSVLSLSSALVAAKSSSSSDDENKKVLHELRNISEELEEQKDTIKHLNCEADDIEKILAELDEDVDNVETILTCTTAQIQSIQQTVACIINVLNTLINELNVAEILSLEVPIALLEGQLTESIAAAVDCLFESRVSTAVTEQCPCAPVIS